MNINVQDITITSIEVITAFDVVTGDFKFSLDELQNATIGQTEERVDIVGKQGRRLNSLKRNKAVTISGTSGLVSAGLMELQTGGRFDGRATEVMWTDYLFANANSVETSFVAVGTTGNEIESVFIKNINGTLGQALTQGAAIAPGVFTYDPATRIINFNPGDIADGAEIVAFYTRRIRANTLDNMSDNYSQKCKLYVDAFGEDTCANIFRVQFFIPQADFDGNFDLAMGETQTVHAFTAHALAGACGTAGLYYTYTIFGAEAEDDLPEPPMPPGMTDAERLAADRLAVENGTFVIPVSEQTDQTTRTAWVQGAVNSLVQYSTAVVNFDTPNYEVTLSLGSEPNEVFTITTTDAV